MARDRAICAGFSRCQKIDFAIRVWRETPAMPQNVFVGGVAKFYDTTHRQSFAPELLEPTLVFPQCES